MCAATLEPEVNRPRFSATPAVNAYLGAKLREFRGNDDGFTQVEIWNVFWPVLGLLSFTVDDNLASDG